MSESNQEGRRRIWMPLQRPLCVEDIELFAEDLDVVRAAAIYKEQGCLVVRGLMREYVAEMTRDIEAAAAQSIALLDEARKVPEGWVTPVGTLFLPAPPHFARDKKIMVLAVNYGSTTENRTENE